MLAVHSNRLSPLGAALGRGRGGGGEGGRGEGEGGREAQAGGIHLKEVTSGLLNSN